DDQPVERDLVDPVAARGNQRAGPQQAEVAVTQGRKRPKSAIQNQCRHDRTSPRGRHRRRTLAYRARTRAPAVARGGSQNVARLSSWDQRPATATTAPPTTPAAPKIRYHMVRSV